jgi:motility quorum-sensing regulator / GCU-specific mRNA interferase toxin
MTEKRTPTHDLTAIKAKFSTPGALVATGTAIKDAAALGFGRQEIVDTIQKMETAHFVKSMTSYADHTVWQDVYNVPHSDELTLYVKFTSDLVTEFRLLSFKESTK